MRTITLVICHYLAVCLAFAQTNDFDKQVNVNAIGTVSSNTVRPVTMQYQGVKGDPYLVSEFRPGKLTLENKMEYKNILINVDLVSNELLVRQSKIDAPLLINRKDVFEAAIQLDFDTTVLVRKFDLPKKPAQYCIVLFEGAEFSVIIHSYKQLLKADYSGAYNQGKNYDEIIGEYNYYLVKAGLVEPFQLKKKSISALFPSEREKFDLYTKKTIVDFKDWGAVKALFAHMAAK